MGMLSRYFIQDYYYKFVNGEIPIHRHSFYKEINGRPVIFIHIPKTAGTSILRSLDFPSPNPSIGVEKHVSVDEAFDLTGEKRWQASFKFACVRNPWDRLYSHYNFKRRFNILPERHQQVSFIEWGKIILNKRKLRMERPQCDWVTPTRGQEGVDRILRFEDLANGINEIGTELGVEIVLPHLLKTAKVSYRDAYDDELRDLVAMRYSDDIERFDYSF